MSGLRDCVLIVDDDAMIADLWTIALEDMGIEVCGNTATAAGALAMAEKHHPRLILMDVRLRGELDGVDAAVLIQQSIGSKVIFVTGSKDPATEARIQLAHPSDVLFKPVAHQRFETAVKAAMES